MPLTAKEAIRRLRREGWREVRQVGSHKQFVKDGVRLTVPDHPGDLKPGVEKVYVERQGGKQYKLLTYLISFSPILERSVQDG